MLCSRARTALSARLDEEDLPPGVTERRLREHLAGCADCRAWEAKALRLHGAVAGEVAGGAGPVEDDSQAGSGDSGPATGSSGRRAC
ncbi:zf-HC2 domain-containing protein [Streptomyces winkii]|uniref:zf-HC2 domain-containing protein n=1 Tax=Streptomyces winkii TaxID=3051178 RepID=UPI0028D7D153|nr:zf-HC2 domain-containing protein [Streptomyces sp. DSM 40971]